MPDVPVISGTVALAKYAASGVGGIASTILVNWRASKEGRARLTSAQYEAEIRVIEAKAEAQVLEIMADAQSGVLRTADQQVEGGSGRLEINRANINQMIEFQSYKRMANTSAVIEDAAEELADKEVPNHEPNPDWTARFFDCVKDVSSDDMQKLWGKILSGEVESPGRTSLRTLDLLRNMSISDARMFETVCTFVLGSDFIFYDKSVEGLEGLEFNTLSHLQDCGLLNFEQYLISIRPFTEQGNAFLLGRSGNLLIQRNEDSIENLRIPSARLTAAGKELCGVVDGTLNQEYLRAFASFLSANNCRLYLLDGVVMLPGNMVRFSSQIPIEP